VRKPVIEKIPGRPSLDGQRMSRGRNQSDIPAIHETLTSFARADHSRHQCQDGKFERVENLLLRAKSSIAVLEEP
jgi:hypothetical protein